MVLSLKLVLDCGKQLSRQSRWLTQWGKVSLGGAIAFSSLSLLAAVETNAYIQDPVKVGVYPGPPKVFWNDQGEPAGFFPDVIQEIARLEGWTLEYVSCQWPDCLAAVEAGELDLMLDVSYSQQRDALFDFNREVLFPSWSVIYARPGIKIHSVLDLHKKRIAVLENGIQYEALQVTTKEFGIEPVFVQSPAYEEMFQMLERGEIDGVVVNRFYPTHQHLTNAVKTNVLIKPDQVHFAAPEGDPDGLLLAIDRHLAVMKNESSSVYYQAGKDWLEGIDIHKTDWLLIGRLAAISGTTLLASFSGILFFVNRRLKREINDRIAAQDQLRHKALYDSLTKLPNRHFLLTRLADRLSNDHQTDRVKGSVMFLDLDRFKVINDSLGHASGDQLLIEMAERLKQTGHWVARLGGDEFVIILDDITVPFNVFQAAEAVLATLQSPCILNNHEVIVTGSLGIVIGFDAYADPSNLLRDADIAMYWSKASGRNGYAVFTEKMRALAAEKLDLENELRRALFRQELILHYQPILGLKDRGLIGFEALVRWQHPDRGLLSPGTFIPLAEDTGLIVPLGWWVLETACRQLKQWQTHGIHNKHLTVNVNVSAAQLNQADFLEKLDHILATTELSGSSLVIEITESLLINNLSGTCQLLQNLRDRSIGISIDDFGTGYSSFGSLHQLPITNLKIDRSFINRVEDHVRNQDIVKTIIMLAHQLGVIATAEGIESEEQHLLLKALGCDLGQGYLFDRPQPAERLKHWLKHPVGELR
jgi:diguanylate cyclase (GGDEF)-like protein